MSLFPPRADSLCILLVEDSSAYADVVKHQLRNALPSLPQIEHVEDVASAIAASRRLKIDLMILDLHLPDSMGLDTFDTMRKESPQCPIIVLTSNESPELALEAVKRGAQDYLYKGGVEDDEDRLALALQFAIERRRQLLRAEAELEAARLIQQSLLPENEPVLRGFDIASTLTPATETAGDFFDFIVPMTNIPGSPMGIAVGDVAGHGFGPAMVMAQTQACLQAFSIVETKLGQVLARTNQVLTRSRNSIFVTMFLGYIDHASKSLVYSSAGHPAHHIRCSGEVYELEATGIPLGVDLETDWPESRSQPLEAGDMLLIMTDGLSEARSESGEMFGTQRILDFVHERRADRASEIVDALCQQITDFAPKQHDDITAILVKLRE